jgi:hypothetical protein
MLKNQKKFEIEPNKTRVKKAFFIKVRHLSRTFQSIKNNFNL